MAPIRSAHRATALVGGGFLLFLLWSSVADLHGFPGLSLLPQAVHFPRLEAWLEWARQRPATG